MSLSNYSQHLYTLNAYTSYVKKKIILNCMSGTRIFKWTFYSRTTLTTGHKVMAYGMIKFGYIYFWNIILPMNCGFHMLCRETFMLYLVFASPFKLFYEKSNSL